jgi:hypothetical protein
MSYIKLLIIVACSAFIVICTEGKVSTGLGLSTKTTVDQSLTTKGLRRNVNSSPELSKHKSVDPSMTPNGVNLRSMPGLSTQTSANLSPTSNGLQPEKKIICYLADWSVKSIINNIRDATNLCTHIIYAFVHFDDATGKFKETPKSKFFFNIVNEFGVQ